MNIIITAGGVGLLTTTMLMQNTLTTYKIQNNLYKKEGI
jgi:5,10-methylene-tetrahydrofolate dehydrogenase/methenyl tetrahydrofolate cyclohydrolase